MPKVILIGDLVPPPELPGTCARCGTEFIALASELKPAQVITEGSNQVEGWRVECPACQYLTFVSAGQNSSTEVQKNSKLIFVISGSDAPEVGTRLIPGLINAGWQIQTPADVLRPGNIETESLEMAFKRATWVFLILSPEVLHLPSFKLARMSLVRSNKLIPIFLKPCNSSGLGFLNDRMPVDWTSHPDQWDWASLLRWLS